MTTISDFTRYAALATHVFQVGDDNKAIDIASFELRVAVGTLIAERPPHRTVQAEFPHTAPTSGE
jgi:hypothetical protein